MKNKPIIQETDRAHPVDSVKTPKTRDAFEHREVSRRGFLAAGAALFGAMKSGTLLAADPRTEPKKKFHVEKPDEADVLAQKQIETYLHRNAERAKLLNEMRPTIEHFRGLSPVIVVRKCEDGRMQGPRAKGCPETIIIFGRSHGAIANLRVDNAEFWGPIQRAKVRSETQNDMPAVIIISGHTTCAAHKHPEEPVERTNARAQLCVQDQADEIGQRLKKDNCFVLAAMTDTTSLGMTLLPAGGGESFNAEKVIADGKIDKPASVFDTDFLNHTIDEEFAHECIKGKKIGELIGEHMAAFSDHKTMIAMETYLLEKITNAVKEGSLKKKPILNSFVLDHIEKGMKSTKDFPESLRPFMTYMQAWNIAHAVYRKRHLAELKDKDSEAYINDVDHAELFAAYGDGFDTLQRNEALLVKPGSDDDEKGLAVAAHVLEEVYLRRKPGHLPLVHINIKLTAPITTYNQYEEVKSRMCTKMGVINKIFGDDVRVLTTYSYDHTVKGVGMTKLFIPLNPSDKDKRIITPKGMSGNLSPKTFDEKLYRKEEQETIDHALAA